MFFNVIGDDSNYKAIKEVEHFQRAAQTVLCNLGLKTVVGARDW